MLSKADFHDAILNILASEDAEEMLAQTHPPYELLINIIAHLMFVDQIPPELDADLDLVRQATINFSETGLWPGQFVGVLQ